VPVVEYVATDIQIKTNNSPKIINIKNTAHSVEITTNKQIYGQPVLVNKNDRTIGRKYVASGKSIIFSFDNERVNSGCYKIIIISNVQTFLTPSGREFKSDWCFKNSVRDRYINLVLKKQQQDETLEKLKQDLYQKNALSENFSNQCKLPEPLVRVEPALYCSNKSVVSERLNQCDAPLIARLCKSGIPILLNKELSKSESRSLTPACKIFADQWVNQETTASGLVYSQLKAELISHAGSAKEAIAWGVALLETFSCRGKISSQCNPQQPTPPDCSAWIAHSSEITRYSNEIEVIKANNKIQLSEFLKLKMILRFLIFKTFLCLVFNFSLLG
jgi:hypothetical protein